MTDQPVPADPRQLRAADTDRDQTAELLRRAAAEGRITFEELDERIGRAYAAKTFADLEALTSDLPGPGVRASVSATPRYQPPEVPAGTPAPSFSVAILSGAQRAGPWLVPPSYTAVAILGGVELDLRHARLTAAEVTIRAFCLMEGVSITVPEDMDFDDFAVSGLTVRQPELRRTAEVAYRSDNVRLEYRFEAIHEAFSYRSNPDGLPSWFAANRLEHDLLLHRPRCVSDGGTEANGLRAELQLPTEGHARRTVRTAVGAEHL